MYSDVYKILLMFNLYFVNWIICDRKLMEWIGCLLNLEFKLKEVKLCWIFDYILVDLLELGLFYEYLVMGKLLYWFYFLKLNILFIF